MSKSYELLIKLMYNETTLFSVMESADLPSIFNSLQLRDSGFYLDLINKIYFLSAYLQLQIYLNDDVTYEIKTMYIGYEILEGGLITW